MELKQTVNARSPWRSAMKGGLVAAAVPMVLGLVFSLFMDEGAQEGIGWIYIAGILAFPVIFVLGTAGGLVAHVARGRDAAAPGNAQPTRLTRAGWPFAGGLAGYAASGLTAFQWPIIGGSLIGIALIPIWIWIGVALGRRVTVSRSAGRPALGGVIIAGAAYFVISMLFWFLPMRLDHVRLLVAAGVGSAVAGLFAYRRLIEAQQSPHRDLDVSNREHQ
jgi:hypothetical protein